MNYDILAFGIHPDDLEIGVFGTLAKSIASNQTVLLVDLTMGEMGSNGTPAIRALEAQRAAKIIGADRICLGLPDRGIGIVEEQMKAIIKCIRTYKPRWIVYPYFKDYHPDHENGSRLIREAIHSSGLIHYNVEDLPPHRPGKIALYYINDIENQNVYVDISDVIALKREALEAHKSQFYKDDNSRNTYLNDGFIDKVISRDAYMGMICKHAYSEPLHLIVPPTIDSLEGKLK